jgi:hypothetical protein
MSALAKVPGCGRLRNNSTTPLGASNVRCVYWTVASVNGLHQLSVFATGIPGRTGEARGRLDLPRREVFLWVCAIIFLNQLFGALEQAASASPERLLSELGAVGFFQFMAWYAIFRLLASSDPAPTAQLRDFLTSIVLCCLLFLPTPRIIWCVALGIAIFCLIRNEGDPKLRAAGIVLAALSIQEFWGHVFFDLFALSLLRGETAIVGTILQAARVGTAWQDNVITAPSGFGIVVLSPCSSFHNLSVAMLCWLTVSNLRNQNWQVRDLVTGALVGVTMIFCNVTRLCLMAWSIDLYNYWHNGVGAQIFAIGASLLILLMSLCGSRAATPAI